MMRSFGWIDILFFYTTVDFEVRMNGTLWVYGESFCGVYL